MTEKPMGHLITTYLLVIVTAGQPIIIQSLDDRNGFIDECKKRLNELMPYFAYDVIMTQIMSMVDNAKYEDWQGTVGDGITLVIRKYLLGIQSVSGE